MLEKTVIVGLVLFGLVMVFNYVRIYDENERSKDKLAIERRAKNLYRLHSDSLYKQLLDAQKETNQAQRDAAMYKTLAMAFQAQKKSAPMAVGSTPSENNTTDIITEGGEKVNA